jgi:predicted house-cleaning NTP pyrophosphatase (Maf/HAM1 superfamily)
MVLNPVISKLSGKLVVLASSSPRRLEILTNVVRANLHFVIQFGDQDRIYAMQKLSTVTHPYISS